MTESASLPPPELQTAMRRALNDNPSPAASDYLDAAERLLMHVLDSDCESRSAALDLLTVDALVTQALQEADTDPATIANFADAAMRRLASRPTT
jgi:hypothetical protein